MFFISPALLKVPSLHMDFKNYCSNLDHGQVTVNYYMIQIAINVLNLTRKSYRAV